MKKNIYKNIILTIIFFTLIFVLTGCSNNKEDNLNEKTNQQVKFLDQKIVGMLNLLNNITLTDYGVITEEVEKNSKDSKESASSGADQASSAGSSDTGGETSIQDKKPTVKTEVKASNILNSNREPDWTTLKTNVENLYTSWSSIVLDLYKVKVNNTDIIDFEKTLDETIVAIKNEDKAQSIDKLTILYSYLPKYLEAFSDNDKINVTKTKYNIIEAYSLVQKNDWNATKEKLTDAENNFMTIINDIQNNPNQLNINKTYILIKEMQNSADLRDLDLFYIKYKSIMTEIEFV